MISLQHDIFILFDIMFYYCSVPHRETDGGELEGYIDEMIKRYDERFSFYLGDDQSVKG